MERDFPTHTKAELRSVGQEMRLQAARLGLPKRESVLPEQSLSPHHGDPTAVDDRPFASGHFYPEPAIELDWEDWCWL